MTPGTLPCIPDPAPEKPNAAAGTASGRYCVEGAAALPEITPDLFAVIEQPNYQVEYLNAAGRRLLGFAAEADLREHLLLEFIPGHCLWTVLNDAVPTAWRAGSWSGEIDLRRHDGTECSVSVVVIARPANKENGERESLWFIARDITARVAAMDGLKRDQRCLRVLLENVPDAIYFKDRESCFQRVSHAMALKYGVSDPRKLEGKSDFDFFTAAHAEPAYAAEQEIIRTERPIIDFEEEETWIDGRVTWVSTTKMPLYNEYGQVIGTFGVSRDITGRKHTEKALAQAQRSLLEASRMAGMAEVASGVLHNIGNAFNSVNTSAALITDHVAGLKVGNFARAVALLQEHSHDIGTFLTEDARGKQLPAYLAQLSGQLTRDHEALTGEIRALSRGIDHIKAVIAMQQSYTRASTLLENLKPTELIDEALRISEASISAHRIELVRDFQNVPAVRAARHRVLEILVNLISNAKQALADPALPERRIVIRLQALGSDRVQIGVIDSGTGIDPANLQRIFSFGFTTKSNGHGYGLHSSAIAAQEMGGSLVAKSDGKGRGAQFYLELPAVRTTPSP